jgi:hypothetical protein
VSGGRLACALHPGGAGAEMRARDVVKTMAILAVAGCVGGRGGRAADGLSAEGHLRAAEREHRLADEAFDRIEPEVIEPAQRLPGERGPTTWTPYDASFQPGEPEYYTIDPRVHDPSERHVEEARRHRANAERHEAAAARKRRAE